MAEKELTFDFPDISAKYWKQKIQADLKGADYNETLVWESPEGIRVKPFYHAEDLEQHPPVPAPCPNPWAVGQLVEITEAANANDFSKNAIERGAEHLHFDCKGQVPDFKALLADIDLSQVSISFYNWFPLENEIEALLALVPESPAGIYLNLDPLGNLASSGNWKNDRESDLKTLTACLELLKNHKGIYPLGIDATIYHEAGGTRVQQLAYALAHLNEYVELLGSDKLQAPVSFYLSVGNDYFFEIAKLRALRMLCSSLLEVHSLEPEIRVIARPGKRNKTLYDYNVNLLRSCTECMSAILGNADIVVNMRYDEGYHEPNEFADRIARNQLLILKHESHFDKVSNPASGAYYLESLTRQLATKSLELFKQLEQGGGYLKQLKEHNLQRKLKESARKEQQAFDNGSLVLVGTNKYPNPEDRMKGELERTPLVKRSGEKTTIEPIIARRLSAKYEQKRLNDE